jgi:hypothetical protein
MPSGWSIRGFAPPGSLHSSANFTGWYEWLGASSAAIANEPNWLFPETSFFDEEKLGDGWNRQTFMIRFEAQSGNLALNNTDTVLIIAPSLDDTWRVGPPYSTVRLRLDSSLDLAATARRITSDTTLAQGATPTDSQLLIGDASNDTILARPVTEIALYDEERMSRAIGAVRLNRATNTMYGDAAQPNFPPLAPKYDNTLIPGVTDQAQVQRRINRWIVGDPADFPQGITSESRIFSLVRYLGQVQEISP